MTPTLSVATPHESVARPIAPVAVSVPGALGGVRSQSSVAAVSDARGDMFPTASRASTSRFALVLHVRPVNVNAVVVAVPAGTPSR